MRVVLNKGDIICDWASHFSFAGYMPVDILLCCGGDVAVGLSASVCSGLYLHMNSSRGRTWSKDLTLTLGLGVASDKS